MGASIQKTSSAKMVNGDHPLAKDFTEWCETRTKLAALRTNQIDLNRSFGEMTEFLEKAAKGVIPAITGAAEAAGEKVAPGARWLAERITGSQAAAGLAESAAKKGLKYAPHAAALVGANEVRRNLKYNPTYHRAMSMVNPVSEDYDMREAEIAAQYGQYPR